MDHHFRELGLRQAVLSGAREVVELFGAAVGDERSDGDDAAIPLR
jgi:hypothetical protein